MCYAPEVLNYEKKVKSLQRMHYSVDWISAVYAHMQMFSYFILRHCCKPFRCENICEGSTWWSGNPIKSETSFVKRGLFKNTNKIMIELSIELIHKVFLCSFCFQKKIHLLNGHNQGLLHKIHSTTKPRAETSYKTYCIRKLNLLTLACICRLYLFASEFRFEWISCRRIPCWHLL